MRSPRRKPRQKYCPDASDLTELARKTLHASAFYKNGGKTKALSFQAKGGPYLRAVATVDDVPKDY